MWASSSGLDGCARCAVAGPVRRPEHSHRRRDYNGNFAPTRVPADPIGLQRAYNEWGSRQRQQPRQVADHDLRGPTRGRSTTSTGPTPARAAAPGTSDAAIRCSGAARLLSPDATSPTTPLSPPTSGWPGQRRSRQVPLARRSGRQAGDSRRPLYRRVRARHPLGGVDETVAAYGTPRFAAGEPEDDDGVKCQLKRLSGDYS